MSKHMFIAKQFQVFFSKTVHAIPWKSGLTRRAVGLVPSTGRDLLGL